MHTSITMSSNLRQAVARLRAAVATRQKNPYLRDTAAPTVPLLTPSESRARRAAFEKYRPPQKVPPLAVAAVLRELYPADRHLSRFGNPHRTKVNHAAVLEAYGLLPRPGLAHLGYEDFESFMAAVLRRRDFLKPGSLNAENLAARSAEQLLQNYEIGSSRRQRHLRAVWQVMDDASAMGIAVLKHEQLELVKMTFFREKPDVMAAIRAAMTKVRVDHVKYGTWRSLVDSAATITLDFDTYRQVLARLDRLDPEVRNTFLYVAMRQNNRELTEQLMQEPPEWDEETFRTVLETLSIQKDERFFSALQTLASSGLGRVDIRVYNSVIAGLCRFGYLDDAENLAAVFSERFEQEAAPFLALMTQNHKSQYGATIAAERKQGPFKHALYPTENTFLPLLRSVGRGTPFSFVARVLFLMDYWRLPLTTRVIKSAFRAFQQAQFSRENFVFVISAVISTHDAAYDSVDGWISSRREHVPDRVLETLREVKPSTQVSGGTFIKLSDELVDLACDALITVTGAREHDQIRRLRENYRGLLKESRTRKYTGFSPTAGDLFERDGSTYIKKGFLIEMMEVAGEEGE